MQAWAQESLEYGSFYWDRWVATYENLRALAAQLIGAQAGEIAIAKNTSEGISTIANGVDWRAGDRIVAFREEFPSNRYPWEALRLRHGIEITWLHETATPDEIAQACRGARLLAISFVQYLSGRRTDLTAIGEICERNGTLFVVDAIQGMGVFPLDVRKAKIHALAADGHKWMMGPEGCAIVFVAAEIQDQIRPTEYGWTTVRRPNDFTPREIELRRTAARYECGSLNTIGCFGLRAALQFILSIGVERIGQAVAALTERFETGIRERGFELLAQHTAETRSGIVSFRKPGEDPRQTVRALQAAGFLAAPRQEWVRVSPHFYLAPSEMDALLKELS